MAKFNVQNRIVYSKTNGAKIISLLVLHYTQHTPDIGVECSEKKNKDKMLTSPAKPVPIKVQLSYSVAQGGIT